MSAARFPSIDNRRKRSLPKFGARCTIKRPPFPLGIGGGADLGFPKSLGNACALLAARAKTALVNVSRIRRRISLFSFSFAFRIPQFLRLLLALPGTNT